MEGGHLCQGSPIWFLVCIMVGQCDPAEHPSDEEPSDSEDEAPGAAEAAEDAEVAAEDTSAAGDGRKRRSKERMGMSAGWLLLL
jgi:hypothetical protein